MGYVIEFSLSQLRSYDRYFLKLVKLCWCQTHICPLHHFGVCRCMSHLILDSKALREAARGLAGDMIEKTLQMRWKRMKSIC